jgi:Uma2 family endonuclease
MAVNAPEVTAKNPHQLPDDGFRHERAKGKLIKKPPAGEEHGDVAMRFGWRSARYVEANVPDKVYAAETGFPLAPNPDAVRALDVSFLRKGALNGEERNSGNRRGAPDLAVEAISWRFLFGGGRESG